MPTPAAPRHIRLLILGSGPAGYSAAVYAARANLKPVLITGIAQGGKLMTTNDLDNWPPDANGLKGPDLMARFEKHAERFETEMIFDHIHTAHLQEKPVRAVGWGGNCKCWCFGNCKRGSQCGRNKPCLCWRESSRDEVRRCWRFCIFHLYRNASRQKKKKKKRKKTKQKKRK